MSKRSIVHREPETGWAAALKALCMAAMVVIVLFMVVAQVFLGCNTSTRDE